MLVFRTCGGTTHLFANYGYYHPMSVSLSELFEALHQPEIELRDSIVEQLRNDRPADLILELMRVLIHGTSHERCDAAEALCRIDSEAYLAEVAKMTSNPEPQIRWFTCGLLYDWGTSVFSDSMTELLITDSDAGVRIVAADCLGRFGTVDALTALIQARDNDPGQDSIGYTVQDSATRAIQAIRARTS